MVKLFGKDMRHLRLCPVSDKLLEDLEINLFLDKFFAGPEKYITDEADVIEERNIICGAMMANPPLTEAMRRMYDVSLPFAETQPSSGAEPVQVVRGMAGIRRFYEAAAALIETIRACPDIPPVFVEFSKELTGLLDTKYPAGFDAAWEKYGGGAEKTRSISYHIRFNGSLGIESVALAGVYETKYAKGPAFNRAHKNNRPRFVSVDNMTTLNPVDHTETGRAAGAGRDEYFLRGLSRSVTQMMQTQAAAVKSRVSAMERGIANELRIMIEELRFALGMVECANTMKRILPGICFAAICGKYERSLAVCGMTHPALAEKTGVVENDIDIGDGRELILLGGVNMGGKSTYLRTAGVAQLFFQMGLPVPAKSACISPASGIYCVFSREENKELSRGKLGRELTDIRDAFTSLDGCGIFLGNEPITGTSPDESYLLSREAFCILKAKRARGIWVSHLFKLFGEAEKLNRMDFGSRFAFMRTGSPRGKYDYKILSGAPEPHSGAKEVYESVTGNDAGASLNGL